MSVTMLSDTGTLGSSPSLTFIETKDKIVVLKIVDNTINTSVSSDRINQTLGSPVVGLVISHAVWVVSSCLCFEEGHAETAGLEDLDHMFNDLGRGTAALTTRDVGLE
ncbi:hypothetical protein HG530_005747 [Fusarium avenaceum]|nr:hypothetical protein HG530_005747 [Fusarium avenaceum]